MSSDDEEDTIWLGDARTVREQSWALFSQYVLDTDPAVIVPAMKLSKTITRISLVLPEPNVPRDRYEKLIDGLADVLKVNQNITELFINAGSFFGFVSCNGARAYLLELLANGQAGEHLEYLGITLPRSSETGSWLDLGMYLQRNRNMKRLHVGGVFNCPAHFQLISSLSISSATQLGVGVWPGTCIRELGVRLQQCSSVTSLEINLIGGSNADIGCLVIRGGSLEHFTLHTPSNYGGVPVRRFEGSMDHWMGLGEALRSTKSVSLQLISNEALPQVLPQLHSVESLDLKLLAVPSAEAQLGPVISRMVNLRSLCIASDEDLESFQNEFVNMIKSSHSITRAVIKFSSECPTFVETVDSFCLVNKVFGSTNLLGFDPSDLWTRIFSKIRDSSARSDFLYRLLRGKPEVAFEAYSPKVTR